MICAKSLSLVLIVFDNFQIKGDMAAANLLTFGVAMLTQEHKTILGKLGCLSQARSNSPEITKR